MIKTKVSRKELAPVVLEQAEPAQYLEQHAPTGVMDDATIHKLVKDINKLGQSDHELIYRLLRKHKPANVFAVNGLGTCFNVFMLPENVRWELYNTVELSLRNRIRERQIQDATDGHTSAIKELDVSLSKSASAMLETSSGLDERTRRLLEFSNN